MTSQIYFDVSHGGEPLGRITFGLFGDDAPRTVANFRQICLNGIDGFSYNGTRIHRVAPRFLIQGGDIMNGDGTGSISIYGDTFEDENLTINHTIAGFLGMANVGPDSNGCQFYVTTIATPWLDGIHTVFGKVTDGEERVGVINFSHCRICCNPFLALSVLGQDIVHVIERVKTTTDDEPVKTVMIEACGEIEVAEPFFITDTPYSLMGWIKAGAIPLTMSFTILGVFQYFIKRLDEFI